MLKKVYFKDYSYYMYLYKNDDMISIIINEQGSFERKESINILKALQYYGIKKNITNNKEIYMLDIGGNIGWYPSFLGRFGYFIISFEPFETNYYILYKNFCLLNKKNNVIIVNKGIDIEEKQCDHWVHKHNIGNGMIICKKEMISDEIKKGFEKSHKVNLIKLSSFIPYLSDKNIALIKIDIEGGEGKAFESGIDLIIKYHVPFIIIEITPIYLKEHGTDTSELIKLFTNNGYYISLTDFVNSIFISETELLELLKKVIQVNVYFIHKDIIN